MSGAFGALLRKEWKEYLQHDAGKRGSSGRLLLLAAFGILMSWELGPGFGSAWYTVAILTLVSILAIVQLVPDAFAGERERHTLDTLLATPVPDATILLAKLAAVISYGIAFAGVIGAAALATELVRYRGAVRVRGEIVMTAIGIALLTTTLIAAVGVIISLRSATVKQATQRLGTMFIIVMIPSMLPGHFVPVALRRWVLDVAVHAGPGRVMLMLGALLATLDLALLGATLRLFNRPRLLTA
jgi:ABC-2 type transport system permease protein